MAKLLSILVLAATCLGAAELPKGVSWGAQAGLAVPLNPELRLTTGGGLNLDLGLHATWEWDGANLLRPRLDFLRFCQGHQGVAAPQTQRVATKVQGLALGGEYLRRIGDRYAAGAGLYLIRWGVDSTNELDGPGGTARASGSSHWTREAVGLVATARLTPRLEGEVRYTASHYGYENLPITFGTLGLLWRF